MDKKSDIIKWIQDINKLHKGNITAMTLHTLPLHLRKYKIRDLWEEFGSYQNAMAEAGLMKKIKIKSNYEDVIDWLIDLKMNPVTINGLKSVENHYGIDTIKRLFGSLIIICEELGLPYKSSCGATESLIDTGTTNIYEPIITPSVSNNLTKRADICNYLRSIYDIDHLKNNVQPPYNKKYSDKYIRKYFDNLDNAYKEAGICIIKYNIIKDLYKVYREYGNITTTSNGINYKKIVRYFGNLKNALNEAKIVENYLNKCEVCEKEFEGKTKKEVCKNCKTIMKHSEQVNKFHEESIKFKSKVQVNFVKKMRNILPDILTWNRYFNYRGALWDATITDEDNKVAIYWYNSEAKYTQANKFRRWLISKKYGYKYFTIEEDKNALVSSTMTSRGHGLIVSPTVPVQEIIEYLDKCGFIKRTSNIEPHKIIQP